MKFTLSWLKTHLETEAGVAEISEALTAVGLEVEEVADKATHLAGFTVAYVVEARLHPNADKLQVCEVDTGETRVQVVCGAPNARTGMKGVFAPSGSTIPGTGLKLKKSNIRGEESNGMLCSEREMGLSEDHEGIIELPEDAPLGAPFAPLMGLDDPLFDIAITPNRADCNGVRGIAHDLAAAGLGTLKPLDTNEIAGIFESPIKVNFAFSESAKDASPMFIGRYVRGVRNGPSPKWLQDRLLSVGLRPISALVDMTNFLTLDLNRPVHVFDADKIKGDLWLDIGKGGAEFDALNEKTYTFDDEMTAIGDETGVLSMAGLMGGSSSGCTEETVNVFIEIALFDPVRTAATGRKLNVESDARYRFERGVDPAFARPGMEIATRMVLEMCGGEPSALVVTGDEPEWRRQYTFRPSRVRTLGGVDGDELQCEQILTALGFECAEAGSDHVVVLPPSWRADIVGEADLVEEILRIRGYDSIPPVSLRRIDEQAGPALSIERHRGGRARRALAARGMMEAVTWSFMKREDAAHFGGTPEALALANPISSELDVMRPSILPNLIAAAQRNADRGLADAALFEVGPQYSGDGEKGQQTAVTGIRTGFAQTRNWQGPARHVDAFDAKADALATLGAAGAPIDKVQTSREAPAWYHPGRSGALQLGNNVLAHFGELHPAVLDALDVKVAVVGFEVYLGALPVPKSKGGRARPTLVVSDFPPVERDFAFILAAEVPADTLVRAAKNADKLLVSSVTVFDMFEDERIGAGKKSVAFSVRMEPADRTLTDDEIEAVSAKIVANVEKMAGGTLRR